MLHAVRQGKLGRWLIILTSFGRVDGQAEQRTIPDWMLSAKDRRKSLTRKPAPVGGVHAQVRRELAEGEDQQGAREDNTRPEPPCGGDRGDTAGYRVVLVEGWPETADPPTRAQ